MPHTERSKDIRSRAEKLFKSSQHAQTHLEPVKNYAAVGCQIAFRLPNIKSMCADFLRAGVLALNLHELRPVLELEPDIPGTLVVWQETDKWIPS